MELQKEKRKIMKQFEETAPENIKKTDEIKTLIQEVAKGTPSS